MAEDAESVGEVTHQRQEEEEKCETWFLLAST